MPDTTPTADPTSSADAPAQVPADLLDVATAVAEESRAFLTTTTEVAAGANPEAAIPLLLLAVSDVLAAAPSPLMSAVRRPDASTFDIAASIKSASFCRSNE